jgi:ribosomal protein S18 acetylase RimI-like enzyme
MQEGMEHIGRHRGQEILLQVESNNEAALHLYYSLGFEKFGMIRRWETNTRRLRNLSVGKDETAEILPLRRQDWQAAYRLDRASSHPDLHWPAPKAADYYKSGLMEWLNNLLNGQKMETWITASLATSEEQRQLSGLSSIKSEWGRPHSVELRVLPSWRGKVERPLLAKVVRRLRYLRGEHILLDHLAEDETVNQLLSEANFQTKRYLTFMKRKLEMKGNGNS